MKKITLNEIKKHDPCKSGWKKLLKNVGKNKADDEPLSFLTILESNGLDDALWCLRVLPWNLKTRMEIADLMVLFTKPIICLMKDDRSKNAVEVLEKFSRGKATLKDLKIASTDAEVAANAANANVGAYETSASSAIVVAAAANVGADAYETSASSAIVAAYASNAAAAAYVTTTAIAAYTTTAAAADAAAAAAANANAADIARIEAGKNQVEIFSAWVKDNEK